MHSSATERPALLTIGIVLQALSTVLSMLLMGLLGLLIAGIFGLSTADLSIFTIWPFSLIASFGVGLIALVILFELFKLYVCMRAWEGDRTWLQVLIVVSLLGALNTGPLSILVAGVTIVGAWQQLETSNAPTH